jgi:hypothetical protein
MLEYNRRKSSLDQVAEKIVAFTGIVAKHTQPLPNQVCEGESLGLGTHHRSPELTFIEEWPLFLCPDCLQEIQEQYKTARLAYKAAPSGLLRGLLAGLLATIPASLLWAAVFVILKALGTMFSPFILIGLVRIMDWVRTKRTVWSMLIAAGLTLISVILGTYFVLLWNIGQKSALPLSMDILSKTWRFMFQEKAIPTILWLTSAGMTIAGWCAMWEIHKVDFARALAPKIKVLEGFREL